MSSFNPPILRCSRNNHPDLGYLTCLGPEQGPTGRRRSHRLLTELQPHCLKAASAGRVHLSLNFIFKWLSFSRLSHSLQCLYKGCRGSDKCIWAWATTIYYFPLPPPACWLLFSQGVKKESKTLQCLPILLSSSPRQKGSRWLTCEGVSVGAHDFMSHSDKVHPDQYKGDCGFLKEDPTTTTTTRVQKESTNLFNSMMA